MIKRKRAVGMALVRSEARDFIKGKIGTGGYDEMIIRQLFPFGSNDLR